MNDSRRIISVYGPRLVAYAVGGLIIVALVRIGSHAAAKPVITAIPSWISSTTLMQVWMRLIQVWDDPSLKIFGMPNRLFDALILVAGFAALATAWVYGSQTMATWGWLGLLFSLEGRLCEHESWRRHSLKQRNLQL